MYQLAPPFSFDNLCRTLHSATPQQHHDGMVWYDLANRWCRRFANHTVEQVAAIVAVFSRNTGWTQNKDCAEKFLTGQPFGHMKPCFAQAQRVLSGEPPLDVLTGWKIRAFYANIADPTCDEVTIDRHAAAILAGMSTPQYMREYKSASENKHLHRKATELYTRAGTECGILPSQAQAIAWLVHREAA